LRNAKILVQKININIRNWRFFAVEKKQEGERKNATRNGMGTSGPDLLSGSQTTISLRPILKPYHSPSCHG
jgi:hypothetical protein